MSRRSSCEGGVTYPKKKEVKSADDAALSSVEQARLKRLEEEGVAPAQYAGVFCTPRPQPLSTYIERDDETVYKNLQGAYICLGSDNLGNRTTGYGGQGETRASKIDLVCGRNGSNSSPKQSVDPLPFGDSARIYISEKTDADWNFGLVDGKVGPSIAKSAVVLKADAIRLVGREGVKIISGIGCRGEPNALGGNITKKGIDLIAGNDDESPHEMQPLVKGDNLVKAMKVMSDDIQMVMAQINNFILYQLEYNGHLAAHPHISPFMAAPTTPSPTLSAPTQQIAKRFAGEMMVDLLKIKVNVRAHFDSAYLNPDGPDYILSEYNNTN